jgi:hypothetical protein
MNDIAFGVIITGATVWAASTVGVLVLGLAAHRKDPRVVIDDPWERPEVRAQWRRLALESDEAEERAASTKSGSRPSSAA